MSLAYWCVLAAAVLPYFTVAIAKATSPYDNANPRRGDMYSGAANRAHAAHANGFEAFPFFAAAVFTASGGAPHASIALLNILCIAWIVLRIAYTAAYLGDYSSLRSVIWIVGLFLTVAIFTMPTWH